MTFLRARRTDLTGLFWDELRMDVEADPARERVPQILHEMAAGERSIVCDHDECEAALRWAQAQPYWPDLPESNLPLYVLET